MIFIMKRSKQIMEVNDVLWEERENTYTDSDMNQQTYKEYDINLLTNFGISTIREYLIKKNDPTINFNDEIKLIYDVILEKVMKHQDIILDL